MIPDAHRYYGAAFCSIVDASNAPVVIKRIPELPAGFYLLNDRIPIYIKYSTSRKSPWIFTFHEEHQRAQQQLYEKYGECLTAFVCGSDGIASLIYGDFRKVLDSDFEAQESISIRRRQNEMYKVTGRDGQLERKVSRRSLTDIVLSLSKITEYE